jgi:hypothetical protein
MQSQRSPDDTAAETAHRRVEDAIAEGETKRANVHCGSLQS